MADAPVLAVVGPTAGGKSRLALEVARRGVDGTAVEIVAADAFTVYRGMDIGTAKPSPDERAAVRHHLLDVLDPWEEASVAWFQQQARAAVADVHARGHVPLLVGGSGLYFRAVVDPLTFPPTDPEVRGAIAARWRGQPRDGHAALAAVDPEAAARIEPSNLRRTVRALEVIELTGRPFSAFASHWSRYVAVYPHLEVRGLDPPDPELRARIASRAHAMVAAGLLDEARQLRTLPRPLSATAAQAIGYREAFEVLGGRLDRDDLPSAIEVRTWRYAKRQRAWFRRDPRVVWSTPDATLRTWTDPQGRRDGR